eukprot:CAMPEP_0205916120 /NCGR_PEP_ID=MMETSP1325-20131115/8302_1 /ASSEMBLY_ACC=CAM_ASM_000708 /TAXON_ID=236786 /ORGANISM="Florenciella sp., Strain RCC1007" /LENGTH=103 /DNA_ID=CAMNT_0053283371 /DNA_START=99 /DNA_END=410 /DNA_ORIENTATION=-
MRATKTKAPQRVRSSPSGFHDEADATRRIVHVQLTGEGGAKHVRPPMPARKLRLARPHWCPDEGSPYTYPGDHSQPASSTWRVGRSRAPVMKFTSMVLVLVLV